VVVDTTTKSLTIGTTVLGRCIVEKGDLVGSVSRVLTTEWCMGEGFVPKRVWDKDVVMDVVRGVVRKLVDP